MSQTKKRSGIPEKNATQTFVTVFVGIIIVLLAVVIIMISAKSCSSEDHGSDGASGAGGTLSPIGSSPDIGEIEVPELKINSIEEKDDDVIVSTTYGELSYPSMFFDLIKVESDFEGTMGSITFSALLKDKVYPAYTLLFNSSEGIAVGVLKLDGVEQPIRVSVFFYEATNELEGEYLASFRTAQETFNDIVGSLESIEGYVSVD